MSILVTEIPVKTKTGTPISLDLAKKQINIEPDFIADDEYITSLVEIAIDKVENDTNSDVLETVNVLTFDIEKSVQDIFYIHQSPLIGVSKLEKLNGTDWTEVPTTDYKVRAWFSKFTVTLLAAITAEELRITYTTGYAAADIPKVLKGAALIKTSDLFDSERQGYTMNVAANRAYETLISKHIRTYWG